MLYYIGGVTASEILLQSPLCSVLWQFYQNQALHPSMPVPNVCKLQKIAKHINSGICLQKTCIVCQRSFRNTLEFYKHVKTCAPHARPSVICNGRQYGKIIQIEGENDKNTLHECLVRGKAYINLKYCNLHTAKKMCMIYSCSVCKKPGMSKFMNKIHEWSRVPQYPNKMEQNIELFCIELFFSGTKY